MTLRPLDAIDTPFLCVDPAILDRNIAKRAEHARSTGLALRPHAKTHKCLEIARRQIDSGATGLTVATIGEAEVFGDAGFDDLFIAYPLWLTDSKSRRLRSIADRARLTLAIDSVDGARRLFDGLGAAASAVDVLVEIDSGHHRTGVAPADAGPVARAAADAGLRVTGVFTFPGHGYSPGDRVAAAIGESTAIACATDELRSVGIEPVVRSGGSTPTVAAADAGVLTEIRPGVYPFNDAQQIELGSCDFDDVALTAIGTVVHRRDRVAILDAGSKILGADKAAWATGFGRIANDPHARVTALSEHHATVEFAGSAPDLGTRVCVIPNHVCNAVNLVDELVVDADDGPVRWTVAARGANA
ncbi:alanine racemase [Jongsikchunia kroppenstedtii]|uniref:alanine racemase n=1 Tax=Jongsikchunia kroppenstedtii TaxID=1121721 RepID=UPI00037C4410|nr:alanine racemase [Jongsikchunia kroppenstedtii]